MDTTPQHDIEPGDSDLRVLIDDMDDAEILFRWLDLAYSEYEADPGDADAKERELARAICARARRDVPTWARS
jgi:hypothetical protein